MDEIEFQRMLNLFPVVRTRDYHAESDLSRQTNLSKQSTSRPMRHEEPKGSKDASNDGARKGTDNRGVDGHDPFWEKLKLAATKKVGAAEAEGFVKAFQRAYTKLVYEELSLDAAQSFINTSKASGS